MNLAAIQSWGPSRPRPGWVSIVSVLSFVLGLVVLNTPAIFAAMLLPVFALITWLWHARNHCFLLLGLILYFTAEVTLTAFLPNNLQIASKFVPEVLLAFSFMVLLLRNGIPTFPSSSRILMLFILVFVAIIITSSIINNTRPLDVIYEVRVLFRFAMVPLILGMAQVSENDIRRLKNMVIFALCVQAMVAGAQILFGPEFSTLLRPEAEHLDFLGGTYNLNRNSAVHESTHIFGTMGNYMNLGTFCVLGLVLLLSRAWSRVSLRTVEFVLAACFLAMLALTFSRLSIFGGLAALAFLSYQTHRRKITISILGFLSLILVTPLVTSLTQEYRTESLGSTDSLLWRVAGTLTSDNFNTDNYSRAYVTIAVPPAVLTQTPIFGIGPGPEATNILILPPTRSRLYLFDMGYVNLFARYGLAGLTLTITVITILFLTVLRTIKTTNSPLLREVSLGFSAYLVALAVFALFTSPFNARYVSFFFWLYLGLFLTTRQTQIEQVTD